MAYLGVQFRTDDQRPAALDALRAIVARFDAADGPAGHDITYHRDNQGQHNFMVVGYWSDPVAHRRWLCSPEIVSWRESEQRLADGLGYFREITSPRVEQFETLYAFQDALPGVGAVMDRTSGEINEHAYDNIALIRSRQDWKDAEAAERALYLDEILPTLQAGMDFLRDNGQAVGCHSNRFVRSIDLDGNLLDQVSVSDTNDQIFEYVNCHPQTGMMRDAEHSS
jgi:aldoxime dehydratase